MKKTRYFNLCTTLQTLYVDAHVTNKHPVYVHLGIFDPKAGGSLVH